jgi:uncharacterized protein (DUF885 family)
METICYTKRFPGHHFRFPCNKENQDLPDLENLIGLVAYGEGWALYTESLGKKLGLYSDPYQYFRMLSNEMHRAIRLVVDTGLHSRLDAQTTIKYSLENRKPKAEASIISSRTIYGNSWSSII